MPVSLTLTLNTLLQEASQYMVTEDFPKLVPFKKLDAIMDNRGAMSTDFCNLDGTLKE